MHFGKTISGFDKVTGYLLLGGRKGVKGRVTDLPCQLADPLQERWVWQQQPELLP